MSTADTVVSHDGKPPETIRAADITRFGRQILFPGQCWVISSSAAHFLWRCNTSDQYLYINGCKYLPISYWTAILSLLDVADGVEEPFLLIMVFLSKFNVFRRPKRPDLCCYIFNGIIKFPLFKHTLKCVPKDDTWRYISLSALSNSDLETKHGWSSQPSSVMPFTQHPASELWM